MRVLYSDPNIWHLNPTANLLPILVKEKFKDSIFYGPGYVSEKNIEQGLLYFIEKNGPFDAVIFGSGTSFFNKDIDEDRRVAELVLKNTATRFTRASLQSYYADVRDCCGYLPVPIKLLSTLNLDYYASTQAQVDILLAKSMSVIGPNHQFVTPIEELPDYAKREKHYLRKRDRLSNAWRDFLITYPERVVTALHFVSPSEFFFDSLGSRSYDTAIPGVEYVLRRNAMQFLKQSSYLMPSKVYFNLYRLASRVGLPVYANHGFISLYNLLFQRSLVNTQCVYTARGGFGTPIRKFFEIPAAGSLLVCTSPNGFGDIGFVDQKHYVEAEPDQLLDILSGWLGTEQAQTVARQGQELVIEKHSLTARCAQIGACVQAMFEGKYQGARWQSGDFVMQLKEGISCVD